MAAVFTENRQVLQLADAYDRIPPEHRPEGFNERMDAARKWLADADLDREVRLGEVDCSALPCIVELKIAFEPTAEFEQLFDDRDFDTALDLGLGRATGLGSSATSTGGLPEGDGWVTQRRWWMPIPHGEHPAFQQRIADSAWGRLNSAHIPGTGP